MSEHDDTRRAFLAGGVGAAAGAAISTDAAAQSVMTINDPAVVREIETEFAGYDRAWGRTTSPRSTVISSRARSRFATALPKISTATRKSKRTGPP